MNTISLHVSAREVVFTAGGVGRGNASEPSTTAGKQRECYPRTAAATSRQGGGFSLERNRQSERDGRGLVIPPPNSGEGSMPEQLLSPLLL